MRLSDDLSVMYFTIRSGFRNHHNDAPPTQREPTMPLTRDFRETIRARVQSDPAFRQELLKEGVECLLSGEVEVGKAVLRDFINATGGFHQS